jgi:hypothetical protein
MKTMRSPFLSSPAAAAIAAISAFWFTFGTPQVARAGDAETATAGLEMALVPLKTIDALEQHIKYLEESIAALKESWQHINTHRLCVSDDSGAETCITKVQLDSFLSKEAHAAISQPAAPEDANSPPSPAQIESAATEPLPSPEPTAAVGEIVPAPEPETTGTVSFAVSGAALVSTPEVEIYEEPTARSDE